MPESVSKLAAFVFANGEMASEILFRDVEEVGEVPGLAPEEREAMTRVEPMLRDTWIGILTACRQAFWAQAYGHAAAEVLHSSKTQPNKMWEKGEVRMPLVAGGRAWCGITLEPWGAPAYHLYVWVWVQPRYRPAADTAVQGVNPAMWKNEKGSYLLTLETPQEGQSYEELADRVAAAAWTLARPIAEAVAAAPAGGEG